MRMRAFVKFFLAAGLFFGALTVASAQQTVHGIPSDVYYMMPEFSDGMIYFDGQKPAQGKLNICAFDNTLRFIDKSGKELVASNTENIVKVRIDTVFFIVDQEIFYRMYPVAPGVGIALRREVQLEKAGKPGAYGTVSQTASIRENNTIYVDGVAYDIDKDQDKELPYTITETPYIYKDDSVLVLNKRNLRKVFPERKAEIDAYFKAGNTVPDKLDDALALLRGWAD